MSNTLTALACSVVGALALAGPTLAKDTAPFPASTATPKVYVIPMVGQMGTDIDKSIYEEIVKDIQKQKPDILVVELKSADFEFFSWVTEEHVEPGMGMAMLGDYRDLVKMLRDELRTYPQVMYVEEAMGWSSLLALSWPHLYFSPDARLIGVSEVAALAKRFPDEHVAAKMTAAFSAIIKGFMEYGGYPLELGDAILLPKNQLSVDFTGRTVQWRLDPNGMWVVDSSAEAPTMFTAVMAEDTLLSDGTADNMDDLMFLLGYREYTKIDTGEKLFNQYKEDWKRAFERVEEWFRDVDNVSGDDPAKAIGKQISLLEKIVSAMKQYPAVERKARSRGGPSRVQLELEIEQLKEQLRSVKSGGAGGGGGRNRGAGGGGGKGGPGTR